MKTQYAPGIFFGQWKTEPKAGIVALDSYGDGRMIDTTDGIWLYCTNSAVRRAARQLGQLYDDAMGKTGLKGTQFSLLSQIAHAGQPTHKELAAAMVMDLSALGHTLKPLIRHGFVEILPDEKDGRVRRVRLTDSGAAKQRELVALWQKAQDRFDAAFGKQKSQELRLALAFISSDAFAEAFDRDLQARS